MHARTARQAVSDALGPNIHEGVHVDVRHTVRWPKKATQSPISAKTSSGRCSFGFADYIVLVEA